MDASRSVLSASDLSKEYGKGAALVHAVSNVSFEVSEGESVAIVGTLIAVAVLTAIPARIGAGRSVADVLRSE